MEKTASAIELDLAMDRMLGRLSSLISNLSYIAGFTSALVQRDVPPIGKTEQESWNKGYDHAQVMIRAAEDDPELAERMEETIGLLEAALAEGAGISW